MDFFETDLEISLSNVLGGTVPLCPPLLTVCACEALRCPQAASGSVMRGAREVSLQDLGPEGAAHRESNWERVCVAS